MHVPTNRSEARDILRKVVESCGLAERGLREDLENAIADMLLEYVNSAQSAGAYAIEQKTLEPVFKLVGSAKTRLRSIQAFHHLQRFDPDMLVNDNRAPRLEKLVIDAIEDLEQAEAKDDRTPF